MDFSQAKSLESIEKNQRNLDSFVTVIAKEMKEDSAIINKAFEIVNKRLDAIEKKLKIS